MGLIKLKTHGYSGTNDKLYMVWNSMLRRCYNDTHTSFKYYGAKGVEVCEEWRHDFLAFRTWAIENGYIPDEGLSIDRVDIDKPYSPENCRIVDVYTQANNKSNNVYITMGGVKKTLTEWARFYNINPKTVNRRYHLGWELKELFRPVKVKKFKYNLPSRHNNSYVVNVPENLNVKELNIQIIMKA